MEVVLSSGDIVTVNEYSYSDLFWALRGGGGSTFGIVTRVTSKTYEQPQINGLNLTILPEQRLFDLYVDASFYVLSELPEFLDSGLSGYITIDIDGFNAILIAPNKSQSDVSRLTTPIISTITNMSVSVIADPVDGNQILNGSFGFAPSDLRVAVGSRLLSRRGLSNTTAIRTMLGDLLPKGYTLRPFGVGGGQVSSNSDLDIALNPAWRKAYAHTTISSLLSGPGYEVLVEALQQITPLETEYLAPLSVDDAAYYNEVTTLSTLDMD